MSYGDGGVEDDAVAGEAASGDPGGDFDNQDEIDAGLQQTRTDLEGLDPQTYQDTFKGMPPNRNITDAERELNRANERALLAIEEQPIGSSPLAAQYAEYARGLAQEDKANTELFDRGSISNFFFGPKGFNKYRGPMAGGLSSHGGIIESIIESLVYLATLGAVDPEFSGGDMLGSDLSGLLSGREQDMGVQIGLPGNVDLGLSGLGTLGMPEINVNLDKGTIGPEGGLISAVDMAANFLGDKAPGDKGYDPAANMMATNITSPTQTTPSISTPSVNTQVAGTPSGTLDPNDPFSDDSNPPSENVASLSPSISSTGGGGISPDEGGATTKEKILYGLLGGKPTVSVGDIFGFAAAQGGEVQKFSPGGVAGLMGSRPSFGLGNDIGRLNQQQLDLMRQRQALNQAAATEGKLGTLGGLFQPRVTSTSFTSFPKFVDGLGGMLSPRPPFPQQRQPLNPETYYHIHEKGEVDYPNFPRQIQPKSPRRPGKTAITDPIKPQPVPEQKVDPYVQPEFIQQNTTQQIAESVTPATPEAELPVTPVTPVSSPTEAPVAESPAQQINPEEGLSSMMQNKEINISMPSNLTATVEFPEQLTGTVNAKSGGHVQNYSLGGIAQLLGPAIAGFAGTPLGLLGSAGLGAAAGYGLAGRKRSFSDAIKGAMLGVAGGGLGQAAASGPTGVGTSGFDFLPSTNATVPSTLTSGTNFQGYTGQLGK